MLLNDQNIINNDIRLANFAKVFRFPVRVAIIRAIVTHHNAATWADLTAVPFPAETINQHISRLKTLGLIQTTGTKTNTRYYINQDLFAQMSNYFIGLLR
ncbi:ArsR/SmtB family transcription factor [Mucilaginibacter pocheonensis]|uniref:Transcriptional regulator n=1 Tax=Mucilaginibacter pocheonensis TaxID=398050 RepID=A0ABU1T8F2_9SPHI|nr:hypothetical protein [Mucilaginibacter pocheonensis]MDR6941627.1 putative transcriptional regulator [Mucilaginibacter pocheonensis]